MINVRYFHGNDQPPDTEVVAAIPLMMAEIQRWLASQLGGPTFALSQLQVIEGLWDTQHYVEEGQQWGRVLEDIAFQQAAPDSCSPPFHVLVVFTHISIDLNGGTPCNVQEPLYYPSPDWRYAASGGGLALFTEKAVFPFMGRPHMDYETTGWPAHEIMHALTLAHPLYGEGLDVDPLGRTLEPIDLDHALMQAPTAWGHKGEANLAVLEDKETCPDKATLLAHSEVSNGVVILPDEPTPEPEPVPELPPDDIIPEPAPEPEPDPVTKPGKGYGRDKPRGKPR